MNRAYGYYNLEIVPEKLCIPLKLISATETETRIPLKQGVRNEESCEIQEIKTVKVVMKQGKIIETVSWTGNEMFIEENGKLIELKPEIKDLMKQNEEKRKSKNIEVLGMYSKQELGWERFNGKHFFTEVGSKVKNQILTKEQVMYSCLNYILTDNYLLIRFFSRSGQELGALYSSGNSGLKLSGLYPDKMMKNLNLNPELKQVSNEIIEHVSRLLKNDNSEPEFKLDWKDYYQTCLEENGIVLNKKPVLIKNKNGNENDELLEYLKKILI